MSYASPRLAFFSNPVLRCNGYPCGVAAGQPKAANAVAAMEVTARQVAAFRAPPKPTPAPKAAPKPAPKKQTQQTTRFRATFLR